MTMRPYGNPHLDAMLERVEHELSRPGKPRAASLQDSRMFLMRLLAEFMHAPFGMDVADAGVRETLFVLRRRLEQAQTAEELRSLVGEVRRLTTAFSTIAQNRAMAERIAELEAKVDSLAQPQDPGTGNSDDNLVTVEKLKEKRVLFAVMPFHEDFSDVWVGGIQRAATGTGLTPIRIDMISKSSAITDDIVSVIDLAEIVVVDVTRNNPNVMFEFGFALARRKPHVVISQSAEFLTFDIKDIRTVLYRNCWKGIEDLHKELQRFIRGTVGEKKKKKAKR